MKKRKKKVSSNPVSSIQNHFPKFTITTLGCKVNQSESDAMAHQLKNSGWHPVHPKEKSDLCIINTCTVTQKASMQSRQAVRQAIRSNPGARIIVTGCYAQTEPDEIDKINGIHHIIGHADKFKIPDMVLSKEEAPYPRLIRQNIFSEHKFEQTSAAPSGNRTRPFLKIQDGCDSFCTYCIVPYARGRSRSMPIENVIENIKQLKQAGYHEVVLTGVHLGAYGLDLSPKIALTELLHRIGDTHPMDRVRLSSIEPHELTDDLIQIVAKADIFCHHFHLPLQSGDDLILKKMHRPYTRSLFKNQIVKINELLPDAAIGVDTLIGFPGETEKAFENTYSLIHELPITYLHVFPFSARKGTPASSYPQQVDSKTIKARCKKMRSLGHVKKINFYKKFTGKPVEILIEDKRDKSTGLLKGISSNYIPVHVTGEDHLKNTLVHARIDRINIDNNVFGSLY
ncbi:MAG: tRNA (N(6)-L-threonylcarbamoyladenosine(37)-C(2))-methylthiotransferase MtaB [Deltaproteobacteria bacterium]|nr:tRNA (N(6)-L-threonylcarbamoyladenosine(37)-C(2))-methylthiotransferase MtaB [Deltaproteobacteria bacterium]